MRRKTMSLILALCMVLTLFAGITSRAFALEEEVATVGEIENQWVIPQKVTSPDDPQSSSLTSAAYAHNTERVAYMDTMMNYYLSNNNQISSALNDGKNVIFMFEGGSDNYPGDGYSESGSNIRNQAILFVVQKKNGNPTIVYYCDNSSSIPGQPKDTNGEAYNRQTTILDGVYRVQTCNHHGQYGALNVITSIGYYTPPSDSDGYTAGASGINIHTRTSNAAGSGDGGWSWGCQLVGSGNSSNTFNLFMRKVMDPISSINYDVWINYANGQFNTIANGLDVGYYVVDRQLAYDGLRSIYTNTALYNITKASREAAQAAGAMGYILTLDPGVGSCDTKTVSVTKGQPVGTLPVPTLFGYQFTGWYTSAYGAGTEITAESVVNESMTLYARWCRNENFLKIQFNLNGGNSFEPLASNQLTGVNVGRNSGDFIMYTNGGTILSRTQYGYEIALDNDGRVIDYREFGTNNDLTVPNGTYSCVLTAHVASGATGSQFVSQAIALAKTSEAYVGIDYDSGQVFLYDNYDAKLAGDKYIYPGMGGDEAFYRELPVAKRDGYLFAGWTTGYGIVGYDNSYSGYQLTAVWTNYPDSSIVFNGHRYELYNCSTTWLEAKAYCESKGGHLVTITSAEEQARMESFMEGRFGYYIGATDAETEGDWKWVTGESFSYENWDKSVPEPNGGTNENYGYMVAIDIPPNKVPGEWLDTSNVVFGKTVGKYSYCNTGFICEYEDAALPEADVTFYGYDGTVYASVVVEPSSVYTLGMAYPKPTGGYFSGWSYTQNAELPELFPGDSITVDADVDLYPVYVTHAQAVSGEPVIIFNIEDFDATGYVVTPVTTTISTQVNTSYWTDWSPYGREEVTPGDTVEVRTAPLFRYYYFLCPACGAHEPYSGTSDCGAQISVSAYHEDYFITPYKDSNYKTFSYTTAKYYTTSLGDNQIWIFSAGNLNDTAIGTKDADSNAVVIVQGYSYRTYVEQYESNLREVTAYVIREAEGPALSITSHPEDASGAVNSTVSFHVTATGAGLQYRWQYKTPTGTWKNSSSATAGYNTDTLTVVVTQTRNNYQYRCVVTDASGDSLTSDAATLTVGAPALTITEHPQDASGLIGSTVEFHVAATGTSLRYRWQYKTPTGEWKNSSSTTAGYNTDILSVVVAAKRDGYQYRCVVTNAAGETLTSDAATLTVGTPALTITEHPQDASGPIGGTVEFHVTATGTGLRYRWQYKTPAGEWKNSSSTTAGYNTDTLSVVVAAKRDGYQYRCVVTDAAGNTLTSGTATLIVFAIRENPSNASGPIGSTVEFHVAATGIDLQYQWQYKTPTGEWKNSSATTAGYNTDTLSVTVAAKRNGYQYRCIVTDDSGSTKTSNAATLTVTA